MLIYSRWAGNNLLPGTARLRAFLMPWLTHSIRAHQNALVRSLLDFTAVLSGAMQGPRLDESLCQIRHRRQALDRPARDE
jgi:hypothetical protein